MKLTLDFRGLTFDPRSLSGRLSGVKFAAMIYKDQLSKFIVDIGSLLKLQQGVGALGELLINYMFTFFHVYELGRF